MTTNSHEVWANSNTPLFLANPALSITLSPQSTGGNVVLTNSNGTFLVNGQPTGDVSKWSLYPAISNTIKMDSSGNNITNIGNNLYFNGSLIANASDIQNIGDWSLYNAVSDVNLSNLTSNYSIVGAKNITAISNITGGSMNTGSLTSSGNVSGTIGTFPVSLQHGQCRRDLHQQPDAVGNQQPLFNLRNHQQRIQQPIHHCGKQRQ